MVHLAALYILVSFPDGVDVVHALKKTRLLCAMMVFISFILYLICLSKCFQEEQTFVRHDGCPKLLCAAMMDVQKSYLGDGPDPIKQQKENDKRKSKKKRNQTMKHCCNNCAILEWKTFLINY